jgi:hypothetical protein
MKDGKEHKTPVSSSLALSNKVIHESFHFLTFCAKGYLQHLPAKYQLHTWKETSKLVSYKVTYATTGIYNYVPPIYMLFWLNTGDHMLWYIQRTNKPYLEAKWGGAQKPKNEWTQPGLRGLSESIWSITILFHTIWFQRENNTTCADSCRCWKKKDLNVNIIHGSVRCMYLMF